MLKFFFVVRLILGLALIPDSSQSVAQTRQAAVPPLTRENAALKVFLQNYLRKPSLDDDKSARYCAAFVDLNDDGRQEAIVYLKGRRWCGTGGCVTLVLAPNDSSYRVVTRITITKLPIRVLSRATKGWRDIVVVVSGGGIQSGYDAQLRFDGEGYPSNPSVPPARPLDAVEPGEVVVPSSAKGTPLFP